MENFILVIFSMRSLLDLQFVGMSSDSLMKFLVGRGVPIFPVNDLFELITHLFVRKRFNVESDTDQPSGFVFGILMTEKGKIFWQPRFLDFEAH